MTIAFPSNPTVGQIFENWKWDGTVWVPLGGVSTVTVSNVPPASPVNGQMWWDVVSGNLFVWYNQGAGQWVASGAGQAGPPGPPGAPGPNTMPPGVTDGSNAAAGQVGEYLTVNPTNVAISAAWTTAATLSLAAGDWQMQATATGFGALQFGIAFDGGTPLMQNTGGFTIVSGSFNTTLAYYLTPVVRSVSAAAVTASLRAYNQAGGTVTGTFAMWARRMR